VSRVIPLRGRPGGAVMRSRSLIRVVALLGILAAAAACSSSAPNVQALAAQDVPRMEQIANFPHLQYRIEAGDTLNLIYTFHGELNQEAIVQPDGKITAQQVGELRVAGMTTGELEKLLVEKTSDRLRNPEVVVTVTKFAEKSIYVGGEVEKPGPVPYRRGMTPMQAVISVGGFRETAALDSIILMRTGGDEKNFMARKLDLKKAGNERELLYLAPHDVVYVPRSAIADANLWVKQHITDLIPIFKGMNMPVPLGF
jgi:protein involved in polysaccharide export with SLBB domain